MLWFTARSPRRHSHLEGGARLPRPTPARSRPAHGAGCHAGARQLRGMMPASPMLVRPYSLASGGQPTPLLRRLVPAPHHADRKVAHEAGRARLSVGQRRAGVVRHGAGETQLLVQVASDSIGRQRVVAAQARQVGVTLLVSIPAKQRCRAACGGCSSGMRPVVQGRQELIGGVIEGSSWLIGFHQSLAPFLLRPTGEPTEAVAGRREL